MHWEVHIWVLKQVEDFEIGKWEFNACREEMLWVFNFQHLDCGAESIELCLVLPSVV